MRSRDTITLYRDILANEEITSSMGQVIIHGTIHDGAQISGRDGVTANNVLNGATLTSSMGRVEVKGHIGNNNHLTGRDGIQIIGTSGNGNHLKSTMGTVSTGDINGSLNDINGRDGVHCANVNSRNTLKSSMNKVIAKNIGANTSVEGRDGIDAEIVSEQARLSSAMGVISVSQVKAGATLSGRDGINIATSSAPTANLNSSMGEVSIGGIIQTQATRTQNNVITSSQVTFSTRNNHGSRVSISRNGTHYIFAGGSLSIGNNDVIIDGGRVTDFAHDHRLIVSETTQPPIRASVIQSTIFNQPTPIAPPASAPPMPSSLSSPAPTPDLAEYSQHLQTYIRTFDNKPSFQTQLDALTLTEEEQKELDEKFTCPIMFHVMNIPVSLNETFYDLSTLQNVTQDPMTREDFLPRDIQSARSKVNEINAFIEKVKARISNVNHPSPI